MYIISYMSMRITVWVVSERVYEGVAARQAEKCSACLVYGNPDEQNIQATKVFCAYAHKHKPMTTKTIGVREEVYERLSAEKREDESFSDTIDRLVEDAQSDWRKSFGKLEEEGEELKEVVKEQRRDLSESSAERQREALE